MTLAEVAAELSRRLSSIFLRGRATGAARCSASDRVVPDAIRTGATSSRSTNTSTATTAAALGASHQTGWTGLVAKLLQQSGEPDPGQD